MKNIFIVPAYALLLVSCGKDELDQDSQRTSYFRYVVNSNHISQNARIVRWKQFHSSNDFTDTVPMANYQFATEIIETIYYAQCPEEIIFGARIINASPTDTIYVEIYVDGVLLATGATAGTNEYYQSEITTSVEW